MGRPRKSELLKARQGTLEAQRNSGHVDPQGRGVPVPPDWLSSEAIQVWAEIEPNLTAANLTKDIDSHCLARYCELTVLWLQSLDAGDRPQVLAVSDRLDRIGSQLGMSPGARCKISVPAKAEADALDSLKDVA